MPDHVYHLSDQAEDINIVKGIDFQVNDNNELAPENAPASQQGDNNHIPSKFENWEGVCPRKMLNLQNLKRFSMTDQIILN